MSFNLAESFNASMSDMEMKNEYVCQDRQYIYINDAMNQNYSSGYINFNSVQLVGSDPKKVMDLNNGFLIIPYGATAHLTGTAPSFGTYTAVNGNVPAFYTLDKSDAMLLAPKGIHHLISQISLRCGGVTVHQPISYLNYWLNEKMKNTNSDMYRMYSDILGFAWDSSESYALDSLVLERNNNIISSQTFASGLDAASFANQGHYQRILKNNNDLTSILNRYGIASNTNQGLSTGTGVASSSVLQDVYSPSLIGVYDSTNTVVAPTAAGVYTGANPITTLVFQYIAILPLAFISDFFKNMPSINTLSSFELRLLTNLSPSNQWSITYGNAASPYTAASVSSSQSVGETCPFMVTQISNDGLTGPKVVSNAPTLTVTPFIGYYNTAPTIVTVGNGVKVSQASLTQCQIYIPSVNLTDPYMSMLLDNKVKTILYNDYQQDSTLTNIGPYATAQRLLTYQVSRLRKLYILPYLSSASLANATACDPRQSLLSSAPNTVSFAKISNLQVFLGSVNLFIQPQSFDFLHYLNGSWVGQNITNGGDFRSLSVFGQIKFSDWKRCYNVFEVDLERVSDEISDDTIKNIQLSFKNDTPNTYNYLIIIEYENEVNLDRLTSQIVASANA